MSSKKKQNIDLRNDAMALQRERSRRESKKIELSSAQSTEVNPSGHHCRCDRP